jgi:hypothetical protein
MDVEKLALVLCIVVPLVVGINAALYVSLRSRKTVGQIELFHKAATRARRPWGEEDDALKELSERVEAIKNSPEFKDLGLSNQVKKE